MRHSNSFTHEPLWVVTHTAWRDSKKSQKQKAGLNFRVWGQFEINILKVLLMNTTYFIFILKKFNLSLPSFEKYQLVSGYLQKNTRTQWVDT